MNQEFRDLGKRLELIPDKIRAQRELLPHSKLESRVKVTAKKIPLQMLLLPREVNEPWPKPEWGIRYPAYRNPNPGVYYDQREESLKRLFPNRSPAQRAAAKYSLIYPTLPPKLVSSSAVSAAPSIQNRPKWHPPLAVPKGLGPDKR
jgi:hypothetical protein